MANIINNIFIIQKFYTISIRKDVNYIYGGDVLEMIFQNSPYLSEGLVIKEKVKVFVDKLFDQTGAFY